MKRSIMSGLMLAAGAMAMMQPARVVAQEFAFVRSEPVNVERAEQLEAKARELYSNISKYAEAARLHEQAAELRSPVDPLRVKSLQMAARLYHYSGKETKALAVMERAAEEALASGDVVAAANAYVDASYLAQYQHRQEDVVRLARKAEMLVNSPLLGTQQRSWLQDRIGAIA
jgi:tetratricopeptide (TPR) repeat protein